MVLFKVCRFLFFKTASTKKKKKSKLEQSRNTCSKLMWTGQSNGKYKMDSNCFCVSLVGARMWSLTFTAQDVQAGQAGLECASVSTREKKRTSCVTSRTKQYVALLNSVEVAEEVQVFFCFFEQLHGMGKGEGKLVCDSLERPELKKLLLHFTEDQTESHLSPVVGISEGPFSCLYI